MRGRVAREFRAKRIESLAGGGLHQVLDAPARDKRGTVALANDPLDPRRSLAELSVEDACMLPHKSQEAGGLGHAGEDQPTAFAFGNELAGPLPAPHRAVLIVSDLEKAVVLLPFAKILLPSRREGPDLAADEAADTALRVDPFLEPVGREAAELPKAGGVGDKRPNRRRRLGEMTFPAVAVDGVAARPHAALGSSEDRAGGATRSGWTAVVIARSGATKQSMGRRAPDVPWIAFPAQARVAMTRREPNSKRSASRLKRKRPCAIQ